MSVRRHWRGLTGAAGPGAGRRPRRIAAAAAAAAVALAACTSPAEPGGDPVYAFTLPAAGDAVYRWPAGSTVRVYVAPSGVAGRDALLASAVDRAALDWESALGAGVVTLRRVGDVRAADVVVQWSDSPTPVDTTGCAPVVTGRAATTFCPTPDGDSLERFPLLPPHAEEESAVRMIVTVLAEEAVGDRRVRQLVSHEFGHVLGIGRHSPDPHDLMWDGPLGPDRPSEGDRLTIRRLYRTPPTLVP